VRGFLTGRNEPVESTKEEIGLVLDSRGRRKLQFYLLLKKRGRKTEHIRHGGDKGANPCFLRQKKGGERKRKGGRGKEFVKEKKKELLNPRRRRKDSSKGEKTDNPRGEKNQKKERGNERPKGKNPSILLEEREERNIVTTEKERKPPNFTRYEGEDKELNH